MSRRVSIRGLLTAIDWSRDESVVRVALHTSKEEVYNIEIHEGNRRLLDHLREEVVVTGVVIDDDRCDKGLRVPSFDP